MAASRPSRHLSQSNTATVVGGTGGFAQKLHSFVAENTHSATTYLQVYDVMAPNVGTTVPVATIPLAPGVSGGYFDDLVLVTKGASGAGLSIIVTAGPANTTAPTAVAHIFLTYS